VDGLKPLENLETLKFERCCNVDMGFVSCIRACPALKNFSVRGSDMHIMHPHRHFPKNFWSQLKVLDVSGTRHYPVIMYEAVLKDIPDCSITHLYMERCPRIPRISYDNLKIEFVSVAGLRNDEWRPSKAAFDSIRNWAALPSLKEMNASGCEMSQAQREQLVTDHPNITFNVSVEFQESPRVEF
jgi:hypothetical protein